MQQISDLRIPPEKVAEIMKAFKRASTLMALAANQMMATLLQWRDEMIESTGVDPFKEFLCDPEPDEVVDVL